MKDENGEEKYRVCWNITSKCNENCEYCHRFKVNERKFKENKKILTKMIKDGITNITWSGGEALLYPKIVKLMEIAKENGVKNKLITNGLVISQLEDKQKEELFDKLDTLVLSIDSIDEKTNAILGRGTNHYEQVKKVLDYANDKDIKIDINTVVSKESINKIEELAEFLNNYKINIWKFFKFMPFRGMAKENEERFDIGYEEVDELVDSIEGLDLQGIKTIYYKTEDLVEEDIVLDAQANMYQTVKDESGNFIDEYKGNAIEDNIVEAIKEAERMKEENNFRNKLKVDVEPLDLEKDKKNTLVDNIKQFVDRNRVGNEEKGDK